MQNWRGFLRKTKKLYGLYEWTSTSEAFYNVIRKFVKKEDNILEFGSSTGHISFRLAKEGYDIALLDIRKDAIEIAKSNFEKKKVRANFIYADIFDFTDRYDIAWNSGLIQCLNDKDKIKLIKKMASITNRLLLFYPDVENPNKKRGKNETAIPGVGDAKEYSIRKIPEIVYGNFNEIYLGALEMDTIGLEFAMHWIYAQKE